MLFAGLVRSLVRVLSGRIETGNPPPHISDQALRAARWRAARYGLSGTLWSPARSALVPAATALDDLLAELRDDLDGHGEYQIISELLDQLRRRGTSAQRQRADFAATGSLVEVTRAAMDLTVKA